MSQKTDIFSFIMLVWRKKTMTKNDELNVLRETLKEFGLKESKIEDFVDSYVKRLKMKESFDPDFDDDLEMK